MEFPRWSFLAWVRNQKSNLELRACVVFFGWHFSCQKLSRVNRHLIGQWSLVPESGVCPKHGQSLDAGLTNHLSTEELDQEIFSVSKTASKSKEERGNINQKDIKKKL